MTWTLTKVTRAPNTNPQLARLLMSVTMEFANFDTNGISTDTHTYTEPNVSDVSDAGVARLARDQMRQLEVISGTTPGAVPDLTGIKAFLIGPQLAPAIIAALRAAADFTQTDQQITDALNAVTVANPIPQPSVMPPITIAGLVGQLSPTAQASLANNPNTPTIRSDARAGDGAALVEWAGLLAQKGDITPADFKTVQTACTPVPDPAWPALVSHASLILGRAIAVTEVAVARASAQG